MVIDRQVAGPSTGIPQRRSKSLVASNPLATIRQLLSLSKITDQDVFNVPSVQRGLKAKSPPYVWYSAYQEMKIRNFHINYEKALGLSDDMPPA